MNPRPSPRRRLQLLLALLLGIALLPAAQAQDTPTAGFTLVSTHRYGFDLRRGNDVITVRWLAPDILDVHLLPDATATPDTLVLDPQRAAHFFQPLQQLDQHGDVLQRSAAMQVHWLQASQQLQLDGAQGRTLLTLSDIGALAGGRIDLRAAPQDALYGLGGYSKSDPSQAGILRDGTWPVKAGMQGHPGAPWLWSTAGWGVLVDTLGAQVHMADGRITWSRLSKPDTHLFLIAGDPPALFAALRTLSGAAPLFPKWSLGFINSQWGMDQRELLHIVRKYRALQIPLDAFALDFDWKAWGENDYGAFRWNTVKFPGGPDGTLKKQLDALGVHLIGIQKPRIDVHGEAGRYASEHDFWFPGLKAEPDYFSHKLVQVLDFNKPAVRAWFFNAALQHSFATGIVGWWNDEADVTPSDTEFMNMQRAQYDGQRKYFPDTRVFSLNRDFYLGAQRYAYALWSGDIDTGFASMAAQRERMLSAINTGEMWWAMDGGGFQGHPSDENYARWIEFDAFSPIMRVHGTHDERRQPWIYGPTAQAAATAAIRLRYRLLPYIYSYAWNDHARGIGVVRPLAMAFPDDAAVRNDIGAWMFGDWLLVSPVMRQGQTEKTILLPPGQWTAWDSGKVYAGGQRITVPVDARTWKDIPLFIRAGAIIPMQPVLQYVHQHPVPELTVQVFPAAQRSDFEFYDDNGDNYAYEHGAYYLQRISTQHLADHVSLRISPPKGSYKPGLRTWLFAVHGIAARAVQSTSDALPERADLQALQRDDAPGWARGSDRYGPVTWVRLRADQGVSLRLLAP